MRPAIETDADAVTACAKAAFDRYTERIGQPARPMGIDYLAEIRAGHVWVGLAGSEILGAIVQYETERGFYIDVVAVLPREQGKGVGRALLAFAESEAQRRGCDSIYLCTNAKMTENQVFYPRLGYVEYQRGVDEGFDRVFYSKTLRPAQAPGAA